MTLERREGKYIRNTKDGGETREERKEHAGKIKRHKPNSKKETKKRKIIEERGI